MYHVTYKYLGETVTLKTNIPKQDNETSIPRICVAPTIRQCILGVEGITDIGLIAMIFRKSRSMPITYHIYQPKIDKFIPADESVRDRGITNEYWILNNVVADYLGSVIMDLEHLEDLKKFGIL